MGARLPGTDWALLIQEALTEPRKVVRAHTFVHAWGSASRPVQVTCDDGADWVIKGRQSGKQAVTDQILGVLGRSLGAPIPEICLVEVPQELIDAEPEMGHIASGLAHGSRFEAGYTDRQWLDHAIPENERPFAHLAGFYGWGLAQDHQLIYRIAAPCLVRSVDHGHFVGGGSWSLANLVGLPTDADLYGEIVAHSRPSPPLLEGVRTQLKALTDESIASAVARPGLDWDISLEERKALADLLAARRDSLLVRLEASRP